MLVALGKANKQIARQLHISEWTVASYIRRIFNKLGVDSRAAMVYYCASLIQRYCQRGATQKSCIDLTQSRQGIDEERELEPDVSFHS